MSLSLPTKFDNVEAVDPGRNASVWKARNALLNRTVFLKVYDIPRSDPESALHEPRLLEELNHPNLVKIYSADILAREPGAFVGRILLEMELVAGGSLQDLISASLSSGRWPPVHEIVELVRDTLAGVAHMHSHGIVHRDLKPANVMVRSVRGRRQAVVSDLGLASRLSASGRALPSRHSLLYRPPEVWNGSGYSRSSDAYQIGVVLFQLLGGQIDYKLGKLPEADVGKAILGGRLLRWAGFGPHVGARLRSIVKRCVGDEKQRYADLSELSVDLHNCKGAQPNCVFQVIPGGFMIECERKGRIDRVTVVGTGVGNQCRIERTSRVNTPNFRRRGKPEVIDHPDLARCQRFRRILHRTWGA